MSGDGESDDSTTIRRKILLSPTIPPLGYIDHDGSPLANLIGQVRPPTLHRLTYSDYRTGQCLERNAALRPKVGDIKKHTYFTAV